LRIGKLRVKSAATVGVPEEEGFSAERHISRKAGGRGSWKWAEQ